MAEDGSIVINTQIDTEGVESGMAKLKSVIEKGMGEAGSAAAGLLKTVEEALDGRSLIKGAQCMVGAIAEGLSGGKAELSLAADGAAAAAESGVVGRKDGFLNGGRTLLGALISGFASEKARLGVQASKTAEETVKAIDKRDSFSDMGENLMSALRSGIAMQAASLYAKAAEIASTVTASFKAIFKIHSPSAVFRDEIGKMLMLGLRDGILGNAASVLAATEALSADMLESEKKYLAEKQRISEKNDAEDERVRVRNYEKRLAAAKTWRDREEIIADERLRLRKRADSKYLEQLKENADREKEIIKALKNDITSVYKEIADYVENSLEPVEESRKRLGEKLKKYAQDNSSGTIEVIVRGSGKEVETYGGQKIIDNDITLYSLANQQKSIEVLERYSKAISSVKAKITELYTAETARAFMETLVGMDVEDGALFAETLAAATEDDFKKYIEDWGHKNTLADEIAKQLYGDAFTEAVDDCTQYMRKELEDLGLEVPEGFFASGSLSAEQFGKGFSEGIDKVLENARKLIDGFGTYSREVIGEGVSSVVNTNNYYSTYSINGTKSTTAESIFAIEAASAMNKYRGLE